MNKILIFTAILLGSCSFVNKEKAERNFSSKFSFVELKYGICETEEWYSEKQKNAPTGKLDFTKNFKLIKKTTNIPAKIGQTFGIEYVIKSPLNTDIIVEQVWIYPSTISNEKGIEFKELRYNVEKTTNDTTFSVFEIEKEFELVKGEWVYQMFYENEKLYEKKFYLE
jgi:hypothetical protein